MLQVLYLNLFFLPSAYSPYDRRCIGDFDIVRLDVHGVAFAAHHFIVTVYIPQSRGELARVRWHL